MCRPKKIMIVCEDKLHDNFICNFLMTYYDWSKREVKRITARSDYPKDGSGGAGEKHVRERYPIELNVFRSTNHYRMLVAVVDADTESVEQHHNELDRMARDNGIGGPRKSDEAVIHIIPKRSNKLPRRKRTGYSE